MRYLLDTHAFLWYIKGDARLSVNSRNIIENVSLEKFVSIGSLWEVAIKLSRDKSKEDLIFSEPFEVLQQYIDLNKFHTLPIRIEHLYEIKNLPHHHGDPFDRLLIAQAMAEEMTVISIDKAFKAYAVNILW